jgi:glycerol-3-phosphate dehydrogenase (NAD(P)+)
MTTVAVLGAGAWGTTFAKVLADGGADVQLWARRDEIAREINETHRNTTYLQRVNLPLNVTASSSLAATLAGDPASALADSLLGDLARFLEAFPPTDPVWSNIQNAMGSTLARNTTPDSLLATIRTFFRLS